MRPDAAEIILKVVRGDQPLDALHALGIKIRFIDDVLEIESPNYTHTGVRIGDIARGLLTHHENPAKLKEWAAVMLAGSGFIDFTDLENQTGGEILLDALWDASMTGAFSNDAFHRAAELSS